jgi:uncharacterized membrane protein YoaK (UPF0700 family)
MIHLANISDVYSKKYTWIWLVSAMKAGFINSAGFLATGKFVSHVTGFGTQAGIAFGHHEYFFGAELLIIPISFIAGGVLTSWILDRDHGFETPPYHFVQGLITLLIGAVIFLGESDLLNKGLPFDQDEKYNLVEFAIISLLCLICGLKNALITWSTGGKIRVTHLTGLSTDIGLNLLNMFNLGRNKKKKESRVVNIVRIATFLSFSSGALISAMIFPAIGFKTFIIAFVISLFMTTISLVDRQKYAKRLKEDQKIIPLTN